MPTSYTSLLGLALPVTGELSGTWGDIVNDYITKYVDASVAGTQTISGSQTAVTLSVTTNANLSQVGSGATGSAQYTIINCTGNPASLLTITAPAQSKTYLIINATSTNQSVKIVGAGPTTGVTLIAGERALVAWNGSDFIKVATTAAAGGSNTQVQFNNNGVLAGSANMTFNGTRLTVADLADSGLTATRVVYSTTGGALTDSANLTFDGTNLTLGGGTANGVAYLNGSKVLTTGSALTFDGASLRLANAVGTTANGLRLDGGAQAHYWYLSDNVTSAYEIGSGSGQWKWLNSNGEQMRLTSTGLGIGTSSPNSRLVVQQANNTGDGIRLFANGNDSQLLTRYVASIDAWQVSASYASTGAYKPIAWFTSDVERMRLDSSGNLGIGTSSPANKLDVVGSAPTIRVYSNNSGATTATMLIDAFDNTGFSDLSFSRAQLAATQRIRALHSGTVANQSLAFWTGGSETMRLDGSGNLGLGVTPSAWGSGYRAIGINAQGFNTYSITASSTGGITSNAFNNGTNWIYVNSQASGRYEMVGATHAWHTAPSGTAGNPISFTQAMTLTQGGLLGVGTTSPNDYLDVVSGNSVYRNRIRNSTGNEAFLLFQNSDTGTSTGDGLLFGIDASEDGYVWNHENKAILFGTNNTERARITSGGEFYIAGTTDQGAYNLQVNGTGVWGAGAYVNGSDVRLKDNIQTLNDGLSVVEQLRPVTYQYKPEYSKDQSVQPGFIAQELQQAMSGKPYLDGVVQSGPEYLSVAYQNLIPILTKAIQELKAELDTVKTELATLKGQP